jgi:hypothetical protein
MVTTRVSPVALRKGIGWDQIAQKPSNLSRHSPDLGGLCTLLLMEQIPAQGRCREPQEGGEIPQRKVTHCLGSSSPDSFRRALPGQRATSQAESLGAQECLESSMEHGSMLCYGLFWSLCLVPHSSDKHSPRLTGRKACKHWIKLLDVQDPGQASLGRLQHSLTSKNKRL